MGIGPFSSCFTYEVGKTISVNPNIKNFRIVRVQQVDNNLVVELNYPNCTNFEGYKILLYRNLSVQEFKSFKIIDPHFEKSTPEQVYPFARFRPTESGWIAAIRLARLLK